MSRWWLLIVLVALGLAAASLAVTNRPSTYDDADVQTLRVANGLLERGQTGEALVLYEQLAAQGMDHPTLLFNLSNAHHSAGNRGGALYYALRARALAPRDTDIATNLALIEQEFGVKRAADQLPARVVAALDTLVSFDESAALALALWIAFALLLLAVRRLGRGLARRVATLALVVVAVLFAVSGVLFGVRLFNHVARPLAVVLPEQVALGSAPGASAGNAPALSGGTLVRVVERGDDWLRVTVEGARGEGWVPASSVGIVG